jgi:hypothetical protein
MTRTPDFFLSSAGEYAPLADPRACNCVARLRDAMRDDYMLIEIDPPLQDFRLSQSVANANALLISTKLQGETLFPIARWPVSVYVAVILDESVGRNHEFTLEQIQLIAWGMLFQSAADARSHASKLSN